MMLPITCSNKINKIPYFKGFFIINFIKKMVIFHVFHLFHGNFMVIFANKKWTANTLKLEAKKIKNIVIVIYWKGKFLLTVIEDAITKNISNINQ